MSLEGAEQSLQEHLRELRSRALKVAAVFIMASVVVYFWRTVIIHLLLDPLHQTVYYTTPQGGMEFLFRVILTLGFIVVVPILMHQLVRFIQPALGTKFSRKFMTKLFIASLVLVVVGLFFGYLVILPITLHFFAGFAGNGIKPLISANDYLSLIISILTTFALIFQLPLLLLLIDRIKPISPKKLMHYQPHMIVGSLVVALILPFTYDPLTQFIMAVPIILLYELSIILIVWSHARQRQSAILNKAYELIALEEQKARIMNHESRIMGDEEKQAARIEAKPGTGIQAPGTRHQELGTGNQEEESVTRQGARIKEQEPKMPKHVKVVSSSPLRLRDMGTRPSRVLDLRA